MPEAETESFPDAATPSRAVMILGSCVTRDVFTVTHSEQHGITYYARTSLASVMSRPLDVSEADIHLDSPFQRRMILQDCRKTFWRDLVEVRPDVLILDFIDERFDLISVGDSIVTRSREFENSGLLSSFTDYRELVRTSEEVLTLWKASCLAFIERLRSVRPGDRVVLHRAMWAASYYDADRQILDFPYARAIANANGMLSAYYDYFVEHMPEVVSVSAPCLADVGHMWGLSAYHYADEYYAQVMAQLNL